METRNQNPGTDVGSRPDSGAAPHNDPDRIRQDMKQAGEAVREQARSAGEQIKGSAADAGRQAKEKAGQVAEQAQRKAAEYARQAQSQGVQMLDQQKTRAAGQVHTLGDAVRRAADKFRETKDDNIAGYIDAAADEVQRIGDYLERRDLSSVWRDAQSFGRRRPEWFLGGMFVAGLALTRFLKASAERQQQSHGMQGGQWYEPPQSADMGHRLPDPAHATHRFAGTSGVGGMAGGGGTSAGVSPSSALGIGGASGLHTAGTGTSASLGATGSSASAPAGGPANVYGLEAIPTSPASSTPASIPTLTIPTTPAPSQPRTQPEVF